MIITMETSPPSLPPAQAAEVRVASAGLRAHDAHRRAGELDDQAAIERSRRDQAIREAIDAGGNLRQLAKAVGMSPARLYAILGTAPSN